MHRVSLLLLAFSMCGTLGWSQIFAKAQKSTQKPETTTTAPTAQKLRGVLKELKNHYHADILFEGGLVEGITISPDLLDFNATLSPISIRFCEGLTSTTKK